MRRFWAALSMVALVAAMSLAAGCVESSAEEAQTPADAPTVANSAIQTDADGNVVGAPSDEGALGGGGEAGGGEPGEGDAAAGEQVFATACSACHLNNGLDAGGIGPQLAGAGLDAGAVRTTVENGRGAMPAGLVGGDDLENVVAYVVGLQ